MNFKVVKKGVKSAEKVKCNMCCIDVPVVFLKSPEK